MLDDNIALCDVQDGVKGSACSGKDDFCLGKALAYLANMRTFWMITIGTGLCLLISLISTLTTSWHADLAAQDDTHQRLWSQSGSPMQRAPAHTCSPL